MVVPRSEEMHPDDSSAFLKRLAEMGKAETPHLIGGELIWANRDDEEVDAVLYEMELEMTE